MNKNKILHREGNFYSFRQMSEGTSGFPSGLDPGGLEEASGCSGPHHSVQGLFSIWKRIFSLFLKKKKKDELPNCMPNLILPFLVHVCTYAYMDKGWWGGLLRVAVDAGESPDVMS